MASIDGLQNNALIVNTLDGLTVITTAGGVVDPSLYVPYTSATGNVDLGSFNLSGNSISGTTLTGTTVNGTTIQGTTMTATGNITGNSISGTTLTGTTVNGTTIQGTTMTATGNITGNSLITLDTTNTNNYKFKINDGSKRLELSYTGTVYTFWDRLGDYYMNNGQLHFNGFGISSPDNTNFYLKYNVDSIFKIDQYGNLFLQQGMYFSGDFEHYIGNTGTSNLVFSIQNTYKYKFLINNIERAYINQLGFWTDNGINVLDPSTGYYWTFQTSSSTRLGINYNSGLIAYFDSGTGFNSGQINFTTSLNSITPTVFGYLSGATSNLQAQINAISTAGYITKTGTNTGVNNILRLLTSGSFIIQNASSGVCLQIDDTDSQTYLYNLKSTSLINSVSASYYDVSSSINTSLNNRLTKTGTTIAVNCIFQLASSGNFVINNATSDPIFQCVSNTRNVYIFNLMSTSQINGNSAGFYDFTSSGQTQLGERITRTGTTTGCSPIIQLLTSTGRFKITDPSSNTILDIPYTGVATMNNSLSMGAGTTLSTQTLSCQQAFTMGSASTMSSTNYRLDNSIGQVDLYAIQFKADSTIPNGLTTEVASSELLLNSQINFRNTSVTVNTARQGLAFRLDNRAGVQPFQWYIRLAGSGVETLLMSLYDNGALTCSSITTSTAVYTPAVERGDNAELIIKAGLSDSAPAGSYITLRTASTSLGVNFVNWNNTVNWGSFRSTRFDCNVPGNLNHTTNNINAQKISGYNNYVLTQDAVNGTVKVSDCQTISLFSNGAIWNTGYTFSSIFTKYTDGSVCSIVGTVTCYAVSVGFVTIRVRFTNVSSGTNYDTNQSFYFNIAYCHTTIGISAQPTLPNGVYNVNFSIIAGVGTTDSGDTIKCLVILSPS